MGAHKSSAPAINWVPESAVAMVVESDAVVMVATDPEREDSDKDQKPGLARTRAASVYGFAVGDVQSV